MEIPNRIVGRADVAGTARASTPGHGCRYDRGGQQHGGNHAIEAPNSIEFSLRFVAPDDECLELRTRHGAASELLEERRPQLLLRDATCSCGGFQANDVCVHILLVSVILHGRFSGPCFRTIADHTRGQTCARKLRTASQCSGCNAEHQHG